MMSALSKVITHPKYKGTGFQITMPKYNEQSAWWLQMVTSVFLAGGVVLGFTWHEEPQVPAVRR